jgi:polyisoprenoid-binding protein YceI
VTRSNIIALGFAAATLLTSGAAFAQTTTNPAEVHAGTYTFDPSHSKATWSVTHFGFSTYVGQFATVNGTLVLDAKAPSGSKLNVTVDTTSLGTLNPALDTHLKSADFLDVAKYPQAVFKATSIKVTGAKTAAITGDLTLHGVTKPVTVDATFTQAGLNPIDKKYSLGFAGAAKIHRSDFGIKTYVPVVSDEVTLQFEAELKQAG